MKIPGSFFITFEGIEGSGKTTAAEQIVSLLNGNGLDTVYVQDPGGCSLSKEIRKLLLHNSDPVCSEAELFLFEAARAQLTYENIIPALKLGKVVVSDRYCDSTVAYQGYGRGICPSDISYLNRIASFDLIPDITFLLDLPVETGLSRQVCIDRISAEETEFHRKIRKGFLEIADKEPERFRIIDATQPIDAVISSIFDELLSIIPFRE